MFYAPLSLPSEVGDVSFWLETYTKIPFFDYVDYTGQGYKLGGLYTEEVGLQYYPENALEGGREFFRLRPGASEWNGIDVVLQRPGFGSVAPMELVSDHLWRALARVPTNVVGDVNFYFEGGQRWEAGATTYTAVYEQTVNSYAITWFDEDGTTVLATAKVAYGAKPVYPNAAPSKESSEERARCTPSAAGRRPWRR